MFCSVVLNSSISAQNTVRELNSFRTYDVTHKNMLKVVLNSFTNRVN